MFPALWGRDLKAARGIAVAAVLSALALALSACGGDDASKEQDANEPSGDFPVAVTKAKFPTEQRLALTSDLMLGVKNTGNEPLPELAFTIETDDGVADGSFNIRDRRSLRLESQSSGLDPRGQVPAGHRRTGAEGGLRRPARPDQHLRLRPARPRRGEDDRLED